MQRLTILHGLPGEGKSYALRRLEDTGAGTLFVPDDVCWYGQTAEDEDVDSFFARLDEGLSETYPMWRPPKEHLWKSDTCILVNNVACFLRGFDEDEDNIVLIDDFMAAVHPVLQERAIDWMLSLLPDDVEVVITTNSSYIVGSRDAHMVRAKDFIQERKL